MQIYDLRRAGKEVLLVSSGAVGIGRFRLNKQSRGSGFNPTDSADSNSTLIDWDPKACAAAGQSQLVSYYEMLFSSFDIKCAQVNFVSHFSHSSGNRSYHFHSRIFSSVF